MAENKGNWRVGLSTCGKTIDENLFETYQACGIADMEISVASEAYAALDYKNMYTWAQKYDVKLWSYHLPFAPFSEIDISERALRKQTIEYFSELIKKASDIGVGIFVIHPSGEPIEEEDRKEKLECAKESLAELAEIAGRSGAVMAVEDLPRTCLGRDSSDILELISAHPALRVCFDTNHLLKEDIPTFIRKVGDKIITTHVSDYDFINERHWMPGEGDIEWQPVLAALREVGYNGPWLYEIGLETPKTIERRNLVIADFADNARALFEGVTPAAIGKRKPNLGMWG